MNSDRISRKTPKTFSLQLAAYTKFDSLSLNGKTNGLARSRKKFRRFTIYTRQSVHYAISKKIRGVKVRQKLHFFQSNKMERVDNIYIHYELSTFSGLFALFS